MERKGMERKEDKCDSLCLSFIFIFHYLMSISFSQIVSLTFFFLFLFLFLSSFFSLCPPLLLFPPLTLCYSMFLSLSLTPSRSAGFIWEYSLYLSALPIITSATGLTSWMFAVEGTAANLYLLSLAYAFKQENSNANAKKVFLCSLWYLPLLLGAYIFHSKVWNESLHTDDMVSTSMVILLIILIFVFMTHIKHLINQLIRFYC